MADPDLTKLIRTPSVHEVDAKMSQMPIFELTEEQRKYIDRIISEYFHALKSP